MNSVEIILTDNSIGSFLQKGTYPFIEIGDMILTPRQTQVCAMKEVSHGYVLHMDPNGVDQNRPEAVA